MNCTGPAIVVAEGKLHNAGKTIEEFGMRRKLFRGVAAARKKRGRPGTVTKSSTMRPERYRQERRKDSPLHFSQSASRMDCGQNSSTFPLVSGKVQIHAPVRSAKSAARKIPPARPYDRAIMVMITGVKN